MSRPIAFLEPLRRDVRIDLRGAEACVPKQFLHGAQVRSPVKKVGGCGVAKSVWPRRSGAGDIGQEVRDQLIHDTGADAFSAGSEKNSLRRFGEHARTAIIQVA